jgi:hypothetical protein
MSGDRSEMSAMTTGLVCWKCGAPLDGIPLPVRRIEECPACSADLHVCRLCEFYDPRVARSCREPVAGEVREKDRANFCDYFQPKPGAYRQAAQAEAEQARSALDALFGAAPPLPSADAAQEADAARRRLEDLFGTRKGDG